MPFVDSGVLFLYSFLHFIRVGIREKMRLSTFSCVRVLCVCAGCVCNGQSVRIEAGTAYLKNYIALLYIKEEGKNEQRLRSLYV